jgi:hypothetical protein
MQLDRHSARCNGHKPCKERPTDRDCAGQWNNCWSSTVNLPEGLYPFAFA